MTFTKSAFEGFAWPVTRQDGRLMSVAGNAGLAEFTSSAAETISKLHFPLTQVAAGPMLTADVYQSADLPESFSTDTFRPNADRSVSGFEDEGGGTTDIYTSIDEATLDTSDYIVSTTTNATHDMHVASSGGLTPTSPNVRVLRLKAIVEVVGSATVEFEFGLQVDGNRHWSDDQVSVVKSDGRVTLAYEWADNPETGDAWTEAKIQDFDTGSTDDYVTISALDADGRVYQMWMEVESVEEPQATGAATVDGAGWVEFALDADWSKADATDYSVVLRKTNANGRCVWALLDSGGDCPHVGWASRQPTLTDGVPTALGDSKTAVHPVVLETSGGSASADSQPYAQLVRESVHSGRVVEQEVTPSASLTAGWLRVVAARHPDTAEDLSVELVDRSDGTVRGTLTVAPDDLPDPDSARKLQQVDGAMDSTGSVDTSQHFVRLSSGAAESTPWEVCVLDADAPPVSAESTGFGGTTDQATVDGTEDDDLDAPAVFAAIPSTPANFTAAQGTSGGEVDLSWDATSLGSSFDRYEVLRAGEVIAKVTDESITSLTDTGALQGVQETWEVRVVDTDGIASQTASATATASKADGSHRLTSLADASVDMDVRASIDGLTWRFREQRSISRQMGRDGARVQRASKGRGEELEISAVLQNAEDRALYDDLLEARDADVAHLVLTTLWGQRRYVAVVLDEASERSVVTLGRATVRLVEVATRPTPVEIAG